MKKKRHLRQSPKYKIDAVPGSIDVIPENRSAKRLADYESIPSVVCISGNVAALWDDYEDFKKRLEFQSGHKIRKQL